MLEQYEVCAGLFHGFDRSKWTSGTAPECLIPAVLTEVGKLVEILRR